MKRHWLGALILAVLLVLSLWSGLAMGKRQETLAADMEQAGELSLAGDLQKAEQLAQQVQQRWQAHWKGMAVITDHAPMEEIDGLFARLKACARTGQTDAFTACCARLAQLLEAVGEAHTPMWWNLF